MTPDTLNEQLARQLARSSLPAHVVERKQAALAAFNAVGFPTRKQENWKYTDLKALSESDFDLTPPAPDAAAEAAAAERLEQAAVGGAAPRYVFVDGHFSTALSTERHPAGLTLEPRAGARARSGAEATSPLAALNTAFMQRGATFRVADRAAVGEPVHLIFVGGPQTALAPQLRLGIALGARAELTLVQHFIDCNDGETWLNAVIEVEQAAASALTLYRLQDHAPGRYQTSLLEADLGRDARLRAGYVEVGGRLVRNDINVALNEPGAAVDLFGVTLGTGAQLLDNHIRVDHGAPHTTSELTFRAIVDDKARAVFNGKVVVHQDAQHIDARQSSNNLLLSRRAEIDTKPELEIYADDVKCTHGATVGELDEEQLFYLRARGIDAAAARALLTFAFANSVLERIGLEELRELAGHRVAGRLPHHERWEKLA